jgi:hypothetical protein
MADKVPIFFIHHGYSNYMKYSLRQAVATSPGSEVILLGHGWEPSIDGVTFVEQSACESSELNEFRKNYIHMSYYDAKYDRICFERWFMLAEFMRKNKIEKAFAMDTDVMIFADMNLVSDKIPAGVVCALSYTQQDNREDHETRHSCGHSSYWTLDGILRFVNFLNLLYHKQDLLDILKNKWAVYSKSNIYGGVSDMDSLGLFRDKCLKAGEFMNTNIMADCGGVFDNALSLSEGKIENQYVMNNFVKKLEWHDKMPYCRELASDNIKRFYTLHCQGRFKSFMPVFYSGPDFTEKKAMDRVFRYQKILFLTERFCRSNIKKYMTAVAPKMFSFIRQKIMKNILKVL